MSISVGSSYANIVLGITKKRLNTSQNNILCLIVSDQTRMC